MAADELVRRQVWVQCGGRCVICNAPLLQDHLDDNNAIRGIGEVAHISAEADGGARANPKMTKAERNDPSNLLLLCPNDHTSADKRLKDPKYTAGFLLDVKHRHEEFIAHATALRDEARTTVLRIQGDVRGASAVASRGEAAAATMNSARRVPQYRSDPLGQGIEVSLLDIPHAGAESYWMSAAAKLDYELDRVRTGIKQGHIEHLSVFGFAYVPLLVLAGNLLDNATSADVYQRHRHTDSWIWDDTSPPFSFQHEIHDVGENHNSEAVLIVNASGTVSPDQVPSGLQDLPRITIEVANGDVPGPATFNNRATLANFVSCLTTMLSKLEPEPLRRIRRVHVLAAVPVSAAIELGRQWPVGNAAPTMVVYHLDNEAYLPALEIPWHPPAPETSHNPTGGSQR